MVTIHKLIQHSKLSEGAVNVLTVEHVEPSKNVDESEFSSTYDGSQLDEEKRTQ